MIRVEPSRERGMDFDVVLNIGRLHFTRRAILELRDKINRALLEEKARAMAEPAEEDRF